MLLTPLLRFVLQPHLSRVLIKVVNFSTAISRRSGQLLVYQKQIYQADTASGSLTRLTDDPAVDRYPAWSPDGERLAFVSNRDGNFEIYTLPLNTLRPTRLTNAPGLERHPAWSPDGNYLAFESNRHGNPEIYLMPFTCIDRPDGCATPPIRLTHHPALDSKPAWSPDGKYLAFESERDGNPDIYLLQTNSFLQSQASNRQPQRLTQNPAWDYQPSWTAENRILFTSTRNGSADIYQLTPKTGQIVPLTQNSQANESPAWAAAAEAAPTPVPTMATPTEKID